MSKRKNWLLAATGAAFAAGACAAVYTTKLLVETALNREQPRVMKHTGGLISGGQKEQAFETAAREASEHLQAQSHEQVTITGNGGVTLIGHFYPVPSPRRLIIAFHGWRSSWHYDYGLISDFWRRQNCSVLYVEQRGQNNSGGDYMGFGLAERYDCVSWVDWAVCRCGREVPIYLAGISMGAATVLMAADLDFPVPVHGIMADCGFTSPQAIWKHVARRNLHMSYWLRSRMADWLCERKIGMRAGEHSTVKALSHTQIPTLLIHGAQDHFVPVEMSYENYRACAAPKRLLIVPYADHAMSYWVDREAYERAMLEFFQSFD